MTRIRTALALSLCLSSVSSFVDSKTAEARVTVDGQSLEVIDMHLHPGHFGQMAPGGREFVVASTPEFARIYAPAVFENLLDPYASTIGIAAQSAWAGTDHVLLYAVYTQRTSGYLTNQQLDGFLRDGQNRALGGEEPWAWGLASIDFFDGYEDPAIARRRLDVLASWLEKRGGSFVGIKLAHAHQSVAFDDPRYLGVYDVSARFGVPVVLHTGLSPFPGSRTEAAYYDPEGLEQVVTNYDGGHGLGRVTFVLAHAGQGDGRSVRHALDLAARHPNVALEISALGRPATVGEDGGAVLGGDVQLGPVLAQIRERGLVGRTLYGSDGPQFSGMGKSYLERTIAAMREAGYSTSEMQGVLAKNFRRTFHLGASAGE